MFGTTVDWCQARLSPTSIFALLHRECHRLFPDDAFADLFADTGRRSVPPRIVAVVMVLQRLEGLSDREAVERFTFDARWKYAAGGLPLEYPSFVHTVLVDMRARLANSQRPHRIFDAVLEVAKGAGLVGRRGVLDSTPLYDAVATQDTVTMVRSALCQLLRVAREELVAALRPLLRREDDYAKAGKPTCDWNDKAAREALVDALTRDAHTVLAHLDGLELREEERAAASLLATVVGQDIEEGEDGRFRIARRVAKDRVISTVDPDARHGRKTSAHGFDGYKGHIVVDPDSEIIVATTVTPGNAGDGSVGEKLVEELVGQNRTATDDALASGSGPTGDASGNGGEAKSEALEIYGDAAYGLATIIEKVEAAGGEALVKVQPPTNAHGLLSKDSFDIDVDAGTVRCPAGNLVQIRHKKDGGGEASFAPFCSACPLRNGCTKGDGGRVVAIHPQERTLARERKKQRDPKWKARYRATRPKVERKFGHMMRRRHGGRRARVRGCARVAADFKLLAAAANLNRLAKLRICG